MNKTNSTTFPILLLSITLIAFTANAQEETRSITKMGIGIGISPSILLSDDDSESILSSTSIYFPVTTATFRFEPELGIYRYSLSLDSDDISQTALKVGAGFFWLNTLYNTTVYYGTRAGIIYYSVSGSAVSESESETDLYIGPAIGGEYNFSARLSIGGEAQLIYSLSREDFGDSTLETHILKTRPVFFVRWYF